VADVEPVGAIPGRSPDHRFSLADSGRYNGSSSLSDKPVVHSTRVRQLRILPTRAALLALKFFFDNILKHFMFQTQIRIHLFQAPVFFFQFFQPLQFTDSHAAIFRFPLVEGGFAEPILPDQIFQRYSGFGLLQDIDDLAF